MSHAGYGEKGYWDTRYGGPQIDTYEWYQNWSQLKDFILKPVHALHSQTPHTHKFETSTATAAKPTPPAATASTTASADPSTSAVDTSNPSTNGTPAAPVAASTTASFCPTCQSLRYLIVGCGNSELTAHMWQDGFTNTVSVDYSEVVIEKMRLLYSDTPELAASFQVADCRDMADTPDGAYDVIIDKGTLDAILCGSDSNKHQSTMLAELHRVLKRGGVFILITYGQTSSRLPYLEKAKYHWQVGWTPLGPTRFLYSCTKKALK